MQQLSGFTNQPKQTISFARSGGGLFELSLTYRSRQLGWFFDLAYGSFVLRGQRLAIHPNILRAFRNIIPFGLAVTTDRGYEPQDADALINGTVIFYLYEGAEVDDIDALIDG